MAARYDSLGSPSGCLEGTRTDILSRLTVWSTETINTFSIFWLAGLAGTGKSTIAKTFCDTLVNAGNIYILTFFASKGSVERQDPFRVLYTLVYELASMDATVGKEVILALRSYPDVRQRSMKEQIQRLLLKPLEALNDTETTCPSLMFVIDALDECSKVNGVDGGNFIRDLADALHALPVKMFVTSRLEDNLARTFDSLSGKSTYLLHEIESTQVAADVKLVLTRTFAQIALDQNLTIQLWPAQEDINTLVQRTGHLFIFATTVLKHVGDRRFSAPARLRQIIDQNLQVTKRQTPYAEVDSLYANILPIAAQDDRGQVNEEICERLRAVIGAVVLAQEPLSITSLATLLNIEITELEGDVRALAAVLLFGREGDSCDEAIVRIFHPSFRDYVLERCHDARFSIDAAQKHHDLATYCIFQLDQFLKFDVCDIQNPCLANSKIANPELAVRLRDHGVSSLIRYACSFWLVHLSLASTPNPHLILSLQRFFETHLLHWVELLSLLMMLPHAARTLPKVIAWCEVSCYTYTQCYIFIFSLKADKSWWVPQ